jgi:hypothetical protein
MKEKMEVGTTRTGAHAVTGALPDRTVLLDILR